MNRVSLVEKLTAEARKDLADYEKFLEICGRQLRLLEGDDLEGLPGTVEEKEGLITGIRQRARENAILWSQVAESFGEGPGIESLRASVENIRQTIELIQKAEEKIAEILSKRSREVRQSLGSLIRGGKALDAYQPAPSYAPRFVDRKE